MRSSEIAQLAGVTVRALRHYHLVGVLAEPPRLSNGYREYGVHDLIRILRIKQLASLGISLDRMPQILDGTGGDTVELLAELDRELEAQIERLTEQRSIIAQIRGMGAAPDVPLSLASAMKSLSAGASPDLAKFDRDQSVLLAHLAGEQNIPFITGLYQSLSESSHVSAVQAINERFVLLGPDSSESELAEIVEDFISVMLPVFQEIGGDQEGADLNGNADVFLEQATGFFNSQQRQVFAEIERRIRDQGTDIGTTRHHVS